MNALFLLSLLVAAAAAAPGRGYYSRRSSYYRPERYDRGYDDESDYDSYHTRRPYRYGRDHPERYDRDRPERYEDGRPERYEDSREDSREDRYEENDDDHVVYRFAIDEATMGAYQYHDEMGNGQGFNRDLVEALCEHANKDCYVVMDKATNCWYFEGEHEYPGIGLMAGWYDGCVGLFPTYARMNSFDFSDAYTENMKVGLYYRTEAKLLNAKAELDLSSQSIGFISGWPTSPSCLAHLKDIHNNHFGEYKALYYEDIDHLVEALTHDEVDAIFAPRAFGLEGRGFAHADPFVTCTTQGASMMARYGDSTLTWWNKAFNEMVDSGDYQELCRRSGRKHGDHGELHCL